MAGVPPGAVAGETVNAGGERQAEADKETARLCIQLCSVPRPPGANLASSPATGDAANCFSRIAAFSAPAAAPAAATRRAREPGPRRHPSSAEAQDTKNRGDQSHSVSHSPCLMRTWAVARFSSATDGGLYTRKSDRRGSAKG